MEIGVIFPQTEIEPDRHAVRDSAEAARDMGYSCFFIADPVRGADPAHHNHPSYGMYNHQVVVHESLTLMGYLSAIVPGMGFATGILILPQRQIALVAKQAAEIDALCGGRPRLGIACASAYPARGSDDDRLVPDWGAASADWDAVHLSLGGLLAGDQNRRESPEGWSMHEFWHTETTFWLLGLDVAPEQTGHIRVLLPAPRGTHTWPPILQLTRCVGDCGPKGSAALRIAHGDRRGSLRPDQAKPGLPAVAAAWIGEGTEPVVSDL